MKTILVEDFSLLVCTDPADKGIPLPMPGVISCLASVQKSGFKYAVLGDPERDQWKIPLKIFAGEGIVFDFCDQNSARLLELLADRETVVLAASEKDRKGLERSLSPFFADAQAAEGRGGRGVSPERIYRISCEDRREPLVFTAGLKGDERQKRSFSWREFGEMLLFADRLGEVERITKETEIRIRLNLDGSGEHKIATGISFFDHMLAQLSFHSGIDLFVEVKGDLEVDEHHTIEDTGIALGAAFKEALGNKYGIARYGFSLPMDEARAECTLDFSGRPETVLEIPILREYVGDFPTEMLLHFFKSFCFNAGLNMHLRVTGENQHHMIEAGFKAMAAAIKSAVGRTGSSLPSTKGVL